jgi:hypothetical protein
LGYFGTRLAQTHRSLHSLADPSLVSGEPKASHMAGIKEAVAESAVTRYSEARTL